MTTQNASAAAPAPPVEEYEQAELFGAQINMDDFMEDAAASMDDIGAADSGPAVEDGDMPAFGGYEAAVSSMPPPANDPPASEAESLADDDGLPPFNIQQAMQNAALSMGGGTGAQEDDAYYESEELGVTPEPPVGPSSGAPDNAAGDQDESEEGSEEEDEDESEDEVDWQTASPESILAALAPALLNDAWRYDKAMREASARRAVEASQPRTGDGRGQQQQQQSYRKGMASSVWSPGRGGAWTAAALSDPEKGGNPLQIPHGNPKSHIVVDAEVTMLAISAQVERWKKANEDGNEDGKKAAISSIKDSFEQFEELLENKISVSENIGAGALSQLRGTCEARDVLKEGFEKLMGDPALKGHEDINNALNDGFSGFFNKLRDLFQKIVGPAMTMLGQQQAHAPQQQRQQQSAPGMG